jgi:hypothetical protein
MTRSFGLAQHGVVGDHDRGSDLHDSACPPGCWVPATIIDRSPSKVTVIDTEQGRPRLTNYNRKSPEA